MEAELRHGAPGSFDVLVDGTPVVRKTSFDFPAQEAIVDAVARALGPG